MPDVFVLFQLSSYDIGEYFAVNCVVPDLFWHFAGNMLGDPDAVTMPFFFRRNEEHLAKRWQNVKSNHDSLPESLFFEYECESGRFLCVVNPSGQVFFYSHEGIISGEMQSLLQPLIDLMKKNQQHLNGIVLDFSLALS